MNARFDAWKPLGIVGLWIIVVGYVCTVFITRPLSYTFYHYHTLSHTLANPLGIVGLWIIVVGYKNLSHTLYHHRSISYTLSHTPYPPLSHAPSPPSLPFHKVLAVVVLVVSMGDCVCHRHLYGREVWYVETKAVLQYPLNTPPLHLSIEYSTVIPCTTSALIL